MFRLVYEIEHIELPELVGLEPEDKKERVDEVGLPTPVGPYNAGEPMIERAEPVRAEVGLEVFKLEVAQLHQILVTPTVQAIYEASGQCFSWDSIL